MQYTLEETMQGLTRQRRLEFAISAVTLALPIWEAHAQLPENLRYVDSVVGMAHAIPVELPLRVLAVAWLEVATPGHVQTEEGKKALAQLEHEFLEPIVAIQDDDWSLPAPVRLTFYSFHNLMEHLLGRELTGFGEEELYVAVNQALDALSQDGRMSLEAIREYVHGFSGGRAPGS